MALKNNLVVKQISQNDNVNDNVNDRENEHVPTSISSIMKMTPIEKKKATKKSKPQRWMRFYLKT